MSQQLTKIKTRIKTVKGAYKVTSAMKLVSTVKLRKYKNQMLANKEYSLTMEEITKTVMENIHKVKSPYMRENTEANKNLYVIISSTLGLCGSYNNNIFKVAEVALKKEDDAIILGKKSMTHFKNGEFGKVEGFEEYHSINDQSLINQMVRYILDAYLKGEYKEIHLIYTEFKNSIVFLAKDFKLLPVRETNNENEGIEKYPPLLEPSKEELVNTLFPLYLKNEVYAKLLESEVCEHASRMNAMENATDNAKEILDNLKIEFNKARQTSITQEITEIVAASNAL